MKDIKIQPPPVVTNLLASRFSTSAWLIAITILFFIVALVVTVASLVVAASEKATAENNQITLEKIASFDHDKDTQIFRLEQDAIKIRRSQRQAEENLAIFKNNYLGAMSKAREAQSRDQELKRQVETLKAINSGFQEQLAYKQADINLLRSQLKKFTVEPKGLNLNNLENELKKLKNPVK